MVTSADEAAEADVARSFPHHDYYFGCFIGPKVCLRVGA